MDRYEKKVSVIMGIYNQWSQEILLEAVNSILQQSLKDFEFIIYDDGSDPMAAKYIRSLADLDERIVLIGSEINHGLAFSLNACIDHAKGKYIARMDADDIAMPHRLQRQVDFLEEHPEYMWCGTNAKVFDETGVWCERKMPEQPGEEDYLRFSPYIHPTVVYRAEVFSNMEGYLVSRETLRCEDYEIFMRLCRAGYQGYNIQESLFLYRENQNSYQRRKFKFRLNEAAIRYRNFRAMHILFPIGWCYVLRPVLAGIIPKRMLSLFKRRIEQKSQVVEKSYESEDEILQPNIAREARL